MSGPSITSWNRLEPRPRTDSTERSLAAQVRDPLWFLTRQWQFGEFQGEDAASPAWVQFKARFSKIDGWGPPGALANDYESQPAPLEVVAENEPFAPDDATAVELGQRFETLLARSFETAASAVLPMSIHELIQQFREGYPLGVFPIGSTDDRTRSFRRVCVGRAIDGCKLYDATRNTDNPPAPAIADIAIRDVIGEAVQRWKIWVSKVFGDLSHSDASTWLAERLEYAVEVSARTPSGGRATFDAHPGRDGSFDWYAFDEKSSAATAGGAIGTREVSRSLLPIAVRYPGMPHARWWQMQDRIADFGEIQPELRETAKMVLMDFMFVHGNDWFVVPFTQDVGTLCRVDQLLVHDVFGGKTLVERADKAEPGAVDTRRRWSMFATTAPNEPGGLADYFILPPSAGSATMSGETIESVRFIRDEMANVAWAIEHTTENGIGMPWLGRERTRINDGQALNGASASAGALRYRIQGDVPEHWIPFVPVRIDAEGQVALERSAILRPAGDDVGPPQAIRPVGRILSLADPYRVREEEVSRAGVTVSRVVRRARWIDGSTHLWIARRKQAGRGEGSSGLRFDIAETRG